jgi:hypothetical protein
VPVLVDNQPSGTAANARSAGVATLVTITSPAGVTRARLVQGFQAAVREYKAVSGLLRKYFVLTDDARFGGVFVCGRIKTAPIVGSTRPGSSACARPMVPMRRWSGTTRPSCCPARSQPT